jgi:hypothetical protein
MRIVPSCFRAFAAGTVLAWVVSPAFLSAAPATPTAPDKDEKSLSPVEKLHNDLDKNITIKIEKQPLSIAVEMLRDKSKINIVLDSLTIQQQLGFLPEQSPTPVELDLKDAKIRTVLRAIVAPYGLSYAPVGDSVVITTEDMAMLRQMRQRVSVDLSKVEFTAALKQLAKETATNLILDSRAEKDANAKVSLQLEDVPLDTAVRLLAEMAGLKPVRVGNVLFVTKKEIAAEMRQDPDIAAATQPGQPVPPAFINPPGIAPNPPPVITAPAAPPGVPPAVIDPDKPADPNKAADDKPKTDDKLKTDDKPKDPPQEKKDGDK